MEIIFVDDGSTDKTYDVLLKLQQEFKNFKLIRHEYNQGYGASLKTGIRAASSETIIITDADGSYPNERIFDLLSIYKEENLDMIVGARTSPGAQIPLLRRPAKFVLNKIANIAVGYSIPDINSGLRIFKRKIAMKYMNILCDRFSFTTTITLIMLSQSKAVKYVPIDYYPRKGKSKIHPVYDPIYFLILIFTTAIYFNPLRIFFPIAILLLFFGCFLTFIQAILIQNISTSAMLLISSGFNILILSLIADLIVKSRDK